MKQQPDKLFFDKLNTLTKEAPPFTWERIEDGLDQKRKRVLWLSAAASLSAIAFATFVFLKADSSAETSLAESKSPPEKTAVAEQPVPAHEEDEPEAAAIARTNEANRDELKKNLSSKQGQQIQEKLSSDEPEVAQYESIDPVETTPLGQDSLILPYSEPTQLAFQAPEKKDNITIVLTADQTRNYLVTKNTNTQATSDEKKSSTLKKLLKKAADLKVNQDPFGELRQRKNEILALNFRSDKQRGQKK
jgi:hypothetical protein